jgi:large subunit ribosomal protein L5
MAVGLSVTLRGDVMWEFMSRLISVYIPRIRDFRGLPDKSFDGRGNYSFGVKEQVIFTEIEYDKVEKLHGLDISIVTTANTDRESLTMLKLLGMPFIKRKEQEN